MTCLQHLLPFKDSSEADLHVMLNMADARTEAPLPPMPDRNWYALVDTSDSVTGKSPTRFRDSATNRAKGMASNLSARISAPECLAVGAMRLAA